MKSETTGLRDEIVPESSTLIIFHLANFTITAYLEAIRNVRERVVSLLLP